MEPTQTMSWPSSETHTGMQDPQKRLREMFQSLASLSQLPKRFSPTAGGTQCTVSLLAASRSCKSSTRTYQASMAR